MDEDVVYISRVKIERVKGPLSRAYLPQEDQAEFREYIFIFCRQTTNN